MYLDKTVFLRCFNSGPFLQTRSQILCHTCPLLQIRSHNMFCGVSSAKNVDNIV